MKRIPDIIMEGLARAQLEDAMGSPTYTVAARYLLNADLFGLPRVTDGSGHLCLDDQNAFFVAEKISIYLSHMKDGKGQKESFLLMVLEKKAPVTTERLKLFNTVHKLDGRLRCLDYLATYLQGEIREMDDKEFSSFVEEMAGRATIGSAQYLASFAAWMLLTNADTRYKGAVIIAPRSVRTATDSYGIEAYARLMYYFFNEDHIEEFGMYQQACDCVPYAHSMTYMGLHLICSVRDTDVFSVHHPTLPYSPQETLDRIRDGLLTDEEAASGAEAFADYMQYFQPSPHKNLGHSAIPDVVLRIPQSLEIHFGKLFLICEAHLQLSDAAGKDRPLFKRVSSYRSLKRLFGDEVADCFKERDFCPTAMSKTFMQALSIMASQQRVTAGPESALAFAVRLAGFARSHKGTADSFSATTMTYLTGGSLGLLTPELVAGELYERGVLSCVTSEFLCLLSNDEFKALDFVQQTALFSELGITPLEIEKVMEAYLAEREDARANFQMILSVTDPDAQKEMILSVLHSIAAGLAPGKDAGAHCLLNAFGQVCQDLEARGCLACPYRIETRATLYQAASELARLKKLQKEATTPGSQKKYQLIAKNFLLPSIARTVAAAKEAYGEKAGDIVLHLIKKAMKKEEEE